MIWDINIPLLLFVGFLFFCWGWKSGVDHSVKAMRRAARGGRL
jgi:hypothetical protein